MNPLNVSRELFTYFQAKNLQPSALSKEDEAMFQHLVEILESHSEIMHMQTLDINEFEPVPEMDFVSDE